MHISYLFLFIISVLHFNDNTVYNSKAFEGEESQTNKQTKKTHHISLATGQVHRLYLTELWTVASESLP